MRLVWRTTGFDVEAATGSRGLYEISGGICDALLELDGKKLILCTTPAVAQQIAQLFEDRNPSIVALAKKAYSIIGQPYPFGD